MILALLSSLALLASPALEVEIVPGGFFVPSVVFRELVQAAETSSAAQARAVALQVEVNELRLETSSLKTTIKLLEKDSEGSPLVWAAAGFGLCSLAVFTARQLQQ